MPVIHLQTEIAAPIERVFDLSRSIDAHQDSTAQTNERAVAGVTSGLIGLGESVTWEARHLGVVQRLSVKITAFDRPRHFQDVMTKGVFKSMRHDHTFETREGKTVMTDRFEFSSPLGPLGSLVDWIFLEGYMQRLLEKRNGVLKQAAESEMWRNYLSGT